MYGYIYKTTNLINGKIYIGQHKKDFFDEKYYGSGKNIMKAIKKYDKQHFKVELVEECLNQQEMDQREIFYIKLYKSQNPDIGYNITQGGQTRFFTNQRHSEESRRKMSEKAKLRLDKHKPTSLNYKWINKNNISKTVKETDLDIYLKDGWTLGRAYNHSAWNKGLTKDTDARVAKYTESRNKHFANGESIGCFGIKGNSYGFKKGHIPWNKKS